MCNDYDRLGKYTVVTMGARFGSWNKAKEKGYTEFLGNIIDFPVVFDLS